MFKRIKQFLQRKKKRELLNSLSFLERHSFSSRYANEEKMPNEEGVWLGNIKRKNKIDFEIVDKNTNVPIAFISSTKNLDERSGYIAPTLLKTWKGTAVVFDVSDRTENLTAGTRKRIFKNKVLKFDPSKESTEKYNFLSEVRILTENEKEDVRDISDSFSESYSIYGKINPETSKKEISDFIYSSIFYNLYKSFLTDPRTVDEKMIYFNSNDFSENKIVKFSKMVYFSNVSMKEVHDFIKELENSENPNEFFKNIAVEDVVEKYGKDENIKNIMKEWMENSEKELKYSGLPYTKNFMNYSNMKKDKLKMIINETLKCLEIFEKESYSENTSKSSFRINEIINSNEPVTLYFKTNPVDIVKAGPIFKIFSKQFVRKAEENQERIRKELPEIWEPKNGKYNILLIFNEFLSFGKFEGIEKFIKKAKDSEIKTFFNFCTHPEDRIYEKGFLENNFTCRITDTKPEIKNREYDKVEFRVGNKRVFLDGQGSRTVFPDEDMRFPPQPLYLKNIGWNVIKLKEVLIEENEELKKLSEISEWKLKNMKIALTIPLNPPRDWNQGDFLL